MTQKVPKTEDSQAPLDAPPRPELRWIRWCLILFLLSSALIFPLPETSGENAGAGGIDLSLVSLTIALAAGGIALLLGLRHLFVRPGALVILLWFGFVALAAAIGFLQGDEPVQPARALIPPLLLGLGITTTHIAACAGMRAGEAIRYFLIAAGCSLSFRLGFELLAGGLPADEVNRGFLSPLPGFLIAWAVCVLILRRVVTGKNLCLAGLAITATALGTVWGIPIPILIPAAGAGLCLALGMIWRLFPRDQMWKRFAPAGILILLGVCQAAGHGRIASAPGFEFSSDVIGILAVLGILLLAMGMSLRAAWRNSETIMGRWARDACLMFLPFVALLGLVSEGLFLNSFSQPFDAGLTGMLVAMPQFFFNRAFYLRHRENEAAIAPQLILNEEDVPSHWEDAFPSNA